MRKRPRRYASLTEDQIIIRIANAARRLKHSASLETVSADVFAVQELKAELDARAVGRAARKHRRVA